MTHVRLPFAIITVAVALAVSAHSATSPARAAPAAPAPSSLASPSPVAAAGAPSSTPAPTTGAQSPPASASPATAAPATASPRSAHPKTETRCDACHTPQGWTPARFAHARTGFELNGKHTTVTCAGCHAQDFSQAVPQSCAGCHQDPHAREFGFQCKGCHSEDGFGAPRFAVDAHRRSGFSLAGRHGTLPCDECHVEHRERGFTRATVSCAQCHQRDAQLASRTTVTHGKGAVGADCGACHSSVAFTPALLAPHEVCFPIASGVHADVRCNACHDGTLASSVLQGACGGVGVSCAQCHAHRAAVENKRHVKVVGYAHVSNRCQECHHPG